MKTNDEHWELARSIQLTPATGPLPPDHVGAVTARSHPAGWFVSARYRPGLSAAELVDFAEFVQVRTYLLLEQGPQPATWDHDGSSGWRANCVRSRLAPRERVNA
jgi:hypothetical protein